MIINKMPTLALAGVFALALSGSAFAQVGGGTELPSSAKKAQPADQSGSPANKASNGGAGSSGAMKGGAMKGDSSMSGGCGSMKK